MKSLSYLGEVLVLSYVFLQPSGVFAYESITTGESFSTNKDDACTKALDQARESAAQQARVYVSSKYERRIQVLSGDVVDNVTHQTYQSTFGITELEQIINKDSKYDEKTGSITCKITVKFDVDTDAVSNELEARISLEEAKTKEANRKSRLLSTLKSNENKYIDLKEKSNQFNTSIYTASVICKESSSMRICKNELTEKFEKDKASEIARKLGIASKYVTVTFDDFDGEEEHKIMDEYEGAFVISMTGLFKYNVDVLDPYADKNKHITSELTLVNGLRSGSYNKYKSVPSWDEEDSGYSEYDYSGDIFSTFSNITFEISLLKGDLLEEDKLIGLDETEAYVDSLIQLGFIFGVGGIYGENLFKVAFYTGDINIRTCLSVDIGGECVSFSTFDTNVNGIGVEKIFSIYPIFINFGGVFFKVDEKDEIGSDFFQIKVGISNRGTGPFVYADVYTIFPTSKTDSGDFEPSVDISIGVGVRF